MTETPEPLSVTARVDLTGDVFTEEALASLVGQTPTLTINFDRAHPVGKTTITAAEQRDGWLHLTFDLDDAVRARLDEAIPYPFEQAHIGFTIADAEGMEDGHRRFKDVRVLEASPAAPLDLPEDET